MSMSGKEEALQALEAEMAADASLPLRESNLVFGEGNPDADVLFIGEAPGFYEDRERRPFVGRAGQLLDKLMGEIGLRREDVYITNIVKRRPPNNRDPEPGELEAYRKYLPEQIRIIAPKVIVAVGRFAMNFFLPTAQISKDHGRYVWMKDMAILPIYHTAAALRTPSLIADIREDLKKLKYMLDHYEELKAKRHAERGGGESVAESGTTEPKKETQHLF